MTLLRRLSVALCGLAVLPAAQAQAPDALLLRVLRTTVELSPPPGEVAPAGNEEMLVFRDGVVLRAAGEPCGQRSVVRTTASPAALRDLTDALFIHRIGFAAGGCSVPSPSTELALTLQISWLGRPPRQRTITVGSTAGPPCEDATTAIYEAIELFRLRVASQESRSEALIRLGADPACGL